MRQLRLCSKDQKFQFMASADMSKEAQTKVREYIDGNSQNLQKCTYMEEPIKVKIDKQRYLVGMVPCMNQEVIQLPETGEIYILPCEGGFFVATEYEI